MKRITLAVFMVLCVVQLATAQTGVRIFGAQQFMIDDNVSANPKVFLSANDGSMGIDQNGIVSGLFPNTSSMLTILAGTKTFGLTIDGGSTWGLDVVNTNNGIRSAGRNIFGDGVGVDDNVFNIGGGNMIINTLPTAAMPAPLTHIVYMSGATFNQMTMTPAAVNIMTGSGTLNTLPLWTPTGFQLGNSIVTQTANTGINVTPGVATTNNVFVVNGVVDATAASVPANPVWDSRINGDQLVTGAQYIGNIPALSSALNVLVTNAGVVEQRTAASLFAASAMPFADYYALMPVDNAATVAAGAAVAFPTSGPNSGSISSISTTQFNLPNVGTYEVYFQVSVDEAAQLMLRINGVELAYSVVGRATGTSQLTGTCLVTTATVNTMLEVVNPSGNPAALTITPFAGGAHAVSAHLVIKQLK